jgi:hypothetical protein
VLPSFLFLFATYSVICTLTMAEQQIRYPVEKRAPSHHEDFKQNAHYAAEHGHAATDQ